jgi:hypothetical protein
MDIESASKQISSSLYEVIAYFGSACLALVMFLWGLLDNELLQEQKKFVGAHSAPELFVLLIVVGTVTYVYGQLASALSATVIGVPIARLTRRFSKRTSSDFDYDFSALVSSCALDVDLPIKKRNNKWTLIYFIITKTPNVGRDIIKRQARERLARINATNMLFLAVLSMFGLLAKWTGLSTHLPLRDVLRVPSPSYVALCMLLGAAFAFEYYKRRCWNNDLLVKILPAIRRLVVPTGDDPRANDT